MKAVKDISEQDLQGLASILAEYPFIVSTYVYGSVASGRAGPMSDVSNHRRKRFSEDFTHIQKRLLLVNSTAIYWHSLLFMNISLSEEAVHRVRKVNREYANVGRMRSWFFLINPPITRLIWQRSQITLDNDTNNDTI